MKNFVNAVLIICLLTVGAWARPNSVDWQKLNTYLEAPKQNFQLYKKGASDEGLRQYQKTAPFTDVFKNYQRPVPNDSRLDNYRRTPSNDSTFIYYPSNHPKPIEAGVR